MKKYPINSPEAMARILAMVMISDGQVHPQELDLLESLQLYEVLGVSRERFIEVFHDYCVDLSARLDLEGKINLLSSERVNEILDTVEDPKQRILICGIVLDLSKADQRFNKTEMSVFGHMLSHWHLTLDDLALAFANE